MWNTSSVGAGLRATVVVVAVMVDSGCVGREGFNGIGLPRAASQAAAEDNLRNVLVHSYHAEPDDADCLVAEAFRSPSLNPDPNNPIWIEFSKAEFEEFADRCNMDLDDLWRSFD